MAVAWTWVQEFKRCHHCWGEGRRMAQNNPKGKSGFHNILGMVLPDPENSLISVLLETIELWTHICLNWTWTIVITNIKSSPYPSQGPKVTWKLFSPKRLDRTWFYRHMCHVLCSFLAVWNRFLTPMTCTTGSHTAWAYWAHFGN